MGDTFVGRGIFWGGGFEGATEFLATCLWDESDGADGAVGIYVGVDF